MRKPQRFFDKIPAGSQSGPAAPAAAAPADGGTPAAEGTGQPGSTEGAAPNKFEGKTPEEIVEMYGNLEKKFGEQGQQLGEMSKTLNTIQAQNQPAPAATAEPVSYDDQLAAVLQDVDEGKIDFGQAIIASAKIGAAQTEEVVARKYDEFDQERTAKEHMKKFVDDNPDFTEMKESGALDKVKAGNPMHDYFSAFYELKGQQAVTEAFEKGKAEATNLVEGQAPSQKVVSQSGSQAHQVAKPTGPVSPAQRKQNMLDAVKATRE